MTVTNERMEEYRRVLLEQAARIEVLEAEISSRVAGQRSDQERIAALITAGDALAHRMYVTKGWYEDLAAWKQAKEPT